jgi:hypothetical protein
VSSRLPPRASCSHTKSYLETPQPPECPRALWSKQRKCGATLVLRQSILPEQEFGHSKGMRNGDDDHVYNLPEFDYLKSIEVAG